MINSSLVLCQNKKVIDIVVTRKIVREGVKRTPLPEEIDVKTGQEVEKSVMTNNFIKVSLISKPR